MRIWRGGINSINERKKGIGMNYYVSIRKGKKSAKIHAENCWHVKKIGRAMFPDGDIGGPFDTVQKAIEYSVNLGIRNNTMALCCMKYSQTDTENDY